MFNSLKKLYSLPNETKIYFGHEYTRNNLLFCLEYDKNNQFLKDKLKSVNNLLKKNLPTTPSSIGEEKKGNIFLNAKDQNSFKKYRDLKDSF